MMFSELASSVQRAFVMIGTLYVIIGITVVTILVMATFFLARIGFEFFRFRGRRTVICPETGKPVIIHISAVHAALSSFMDDPELHVKACSRWPERRNCGQECLLPLTPERAPGQAGDVCAKAPGEIGLFGAPALGEITEGPANIRA